MTFLTGTGRHRVQITPFFRGQIAPWRSLGVGLVVGSRLHRIRRRCDCPRALEAIAKLFMVIWAALVRESVDYAPIPGVCGVGACACLILTLGNPRETSGPRIDRIPSTRPPWRRRQYRELKKIFFSPPGKCIIDLFGPVANGRILKQLHGAVCSLCALVSYKPLATGAAASCS